MFKAPQSIRAVSFDLAGTLVDRGFVDYFWLEALPRAYAERLGVDVEEAKREVLAMYDEVGPNDLRWYLPSYWARRLGVDLRPLLEDAKRRVEVYSDVHEALSRIARLGVQVAALTNMTRELVEVCMEALRPPAPITVVSCVSDYAMTRKTSKFYELSCRVLRVEPSELLHVGDDPIYDVEEPASIGVRALLIDRSGGLRSKAALPTISSLVEVALLVEEVVGRGARPNEHQA